MMILFSFCNNLISNSLLESISDSIRNENPSKKNGIIRNKNKLRMNLYIIKTESK